MNIGVVEDRCALLPSSSLVVGLAISASGNSKRTLRWALDKFSNEKKVLFKLLHVRPKVTLIPTPMGNYIPIEKVRYDVAAAYKKDVDWQTEQMLLPYKEMCSEKQVEAEALVIEADDVAGAILKAVSRYKISKLVIGASSRKANIRMFVGKPSGNSKVSSRISKGIPSFCTVYVISNGTLSSVHAPRSECTSASGINESFKNEHDSSNASDDSFIEKLGIFNSSSSSNGSEMQCSSSLKPLASENEIDLNSELDRLRNELRRADGMCKIAQDESIIAADQINELAARHMHKEANLRDKGFRIEKTVEIAQREKDKRKAAEKEAECLKPFAEGDSSETKDIQDGISVESTGKQRTLEKALALDGKPYLTYSWEEIESATSSLSDALKIGVGANGTVYKGSFRYTAAAVKILHSNEGPWAKQFNQELEVLSSIRHPHLLMLLGACPEKGCLVYEYMENGSLDDRLHCKDNTLPLPWFYRFRIAWEVASALAFLHDSKPEPIIHRDLKPANILLDSNFVSKIGDVGLSTVLSTGNFSMSTVYKDTAPVGTFFYMDPEYQRTGLVSPKSDTYALGMVILQLLTAKSPMGLPHIVERAVKAGDLEDILDHHAGNWPTEETRELAHLALSCLELRGKDRPGLIDQVLPVLERLKYSAERAQLAAPLGPPTHFVCPILKRVMVDPCMAFDGYTYDRDAIERWLSKNNKSPVTNLPLPTKELIVNQSLLAAIKSWKSSCLGTDETC